MTGQLRVRPVRGRAEREAFIALPHRLHGHDRNWVPPLRAEMRRHLDPAKNPFFDLAQVELWLAWRGDRAVGRLSTQIDRRHLDRHQDQAGHFGFLEAEDDAAVFHALFEAAAQWFRQRGMRRMAGPFSFSINHECGLLVDGFDTPPFVKMGHAPPFYAARLTELGFEKSKDLLAYIFDHAQDHHSQRFARLLERWPERGRLRIRPIDMRRYRAEMELVLDIYNDAWADNWGFVPADDRERAYIAALMRPVLAADWVSFAEWDGEAIGVAVQVPNVNEALAGLDGRLLPLGWARLLYRLYGRGPRTSRLAMAGVRRRFRGSRPGAFAIGGLLTAAIAAGRKRGVKRMEASWMLEDNRHILNVIASLPARHHKTYRLFVKDLA